MDLLKKLIVQETLVITCFVSMLKFHEVVIVIMKLNTNLVVMLVKNLSII